MGKESNFDNKDVIQMKGGVQLTEFAPSKDDIERLAKLGRDPFQTTDTEDSSKIPLDPPKNFEEKMERRAALEPYIDRQPVFNLNGGPYSKYGCMSMNEYKISVGR